MRASLSYLNFYTSLSSFVHNSYVFVVLLCNACVFQFSYETTIVEGNAVKPISTKMQFKTARKVGKTGVMLIGLGGNNGW